MAYFAPDAIGGVPYLAPDEEPASVPVSPPSGTLTFTGYAPAMSQSGGMSPGVGPVTLSGFAPVMAQGRGIAPAPGAVQFAGYAPTVRSPRQIQPATAMLSLSGLIPTMSQGSSVPDLKPVSVAQFRLDFPEFADPVKYTDAQIRVQLVSAAMILGELLWSDLWGYGIELRTAHYLTIRARNAAAVAAGGVGGAVSGLLTSKSVDKVSAGYDVGATTYEGAGFWNTTSYGIEFYQLLMMFGAGPIQL